MLKWIFVALLTLTQSIALAQIIETPTLAACLKEVERDSAGLAAPDVLYVFDIDNTVLALKQNMGSVQWYRWQQNLIKNGELDGRVADNTDDLLKAQTLLYQMSSSVTPEPGLAQDIKDLQAKGSAVLYHTSRSLEVRDISERELTKNQLLPLTKTLAGYAGHFSYEQGPADQRAVSFQNGVYMSAGQDKGIWLDWLMAKAKVSPKHLVFVDDEHKNLANVERQFDKKLPITLCRYGKMDDVVNAFNASAKDSEKSLWLEIEKVKAHFN
jgi:hypothetical protein